jgi:glycerophosphoryl diester phosphodiesterase
MRVIGHRGASHISPENTLAAFEAALPGGFELDVQRLADGTVVVLHDPTLERPAALTACREPDAETRTC